jgi:hypothetical protein
MNKSMKLSTRILIYPNENSTWPWWVETPDGIRPCQSLQLAHAFAMDIQSTKYKSSSIWMRHGHSMTDIDILVPDENSVVLAILSYAGN